MPLKKTIEDLFAILELRKELLATAESCTGGLLAAALTDISGSSKIFQGGVVVYSNSAKQRLLGISDSLLTRFGAVSQEVVKEMAELVRVKLAAHYGIAVTGIAGPGGGTKNKPVGTVWWAISDGAQTICDLVNLKGDRSSVRSQTVEIVLEQLLKILEGGTNA